MSESMKQNQGNLHTLLVSGIRSFKDYFTGIDY